MTLNSQVEFTLDKPPAREFVVRESEHHYAELTKITDDQGNKVWEEMCQADGDIWPCRSARLPHRFDGHCFVCGREIQVQIFRG